MRFHNYFLNSDNIKTKYVCPDECKFKDRKDNPIVGVPLPQMPHELTGVLISRDPTTAFIKPYLKVRGAKDASEWRKALITTNAPPQWIVSQIATFDRKYMEGRHAHEIERLREVITNNVYWTHLHKCCTDKTEKEADSFSYKNARLCADQWLGEEISDAIRLNAKFILCLGRDVESFMREWDAPEKGRIKILYLPHPARTANGAWNPKDQSRKDEIADTIDELFSIISN